MALSRPFAGFLFRLRAAEANRRHTTAGTLVSVLLRCLHLDSDAVERLSRGVEDPSGWLRRHVHNQTSLTIPRLDRLYDIPVWRQLRTVWSKIMHWPLDLVEHENRRPPMMVDGFFVVWLQSYVKHTKALALEEDFVMLWRLRSRRPMPDPK